MCDSWRDTKPLACPDDDWLAKWAPPCPDGNPQSLLKILGFRLKGEDYLQIRVVLRTAWEDGVCQLVVDEHPDRIYVRAIACLLDEEDEEDEKEADRSELLWFPAERVDCPCNWWLDAPLGERVVIDVDTGEELPLYIPRWDTCEPDLYVPRPAGLLWPPADRQVVD